MQFSLVIVDFFYFHIKALTAYLNTKTGVLVERIPKA